MNIFNINVAIQQSKTYSLFLRHTKKTSVK